MSTNHYPLDRRDTDTSSQQFRISEQVALVRRTYPELYAHALDYLEKRFSLSEADIQGEDCLIYLLLGSAEARHQADQLILTHAELTRKAARNAFDSLDWVVGEPHFTWAVERVRELVGATFRSVETYLEGLGLPNKPEGFMERVGIPENRALALEEMNDRFGDVMADWEENDCALDDEILAEHFAAPETYQQKYLTTYFDSACIGLEDRRLQSRIELISRGSNYEELLGRMKKRISGSLEKPKVGEKRRYLPGNVFIQPNGKQAYFALQEACMSPGQRVLATSQEYYKIILAMVGKGLTVTPFSSTDELIGQLYDCPGRFDYIFASEVSRYGTVYPLHLYDEARQLLSPSTKLIVDACQSAGRWEHDFGRCHADAVILSPQKGSDMGMGMGVVAVRDDFKHRGLVDLDGTWSKANIVRTAFAINPDGWPTLSPSQRAQANSENTRHFLQLLSAFSSDIRNRIHVKNSIDTDSKLLGHAVELVIDGVSREEICKHASGHGVYLNSDPTSPDCGESIRVAFHPYMNNDALKILAHVLLKVCEGEAPLDDYSRDQF